MLVAHGGCGGCGQNMGPVEQRFVSFLNMPCGDCIAREAWVQHEAEWLPSREARERGWMPPRGRSV